MAAAAAFTWVSAAASARAAGFAYFNLYVNPANQQVLAWVTREPAVPGQPTPRYLLYYFLGQTGQGLAAGQQSRGSAKLAMQAVDGVVAREGVEVGLLQEAAGTGTSTGKFALSIPKLTRQILAHQALQRQRGW